MAKIKEGFKVIALIMTMFVLYLMGKGFFI